MSGESFISGLLTGLLTYHVANHVYKYVKSRNKLSQSKREIQMIQQAHNKKGK